ncbi:MAG: hypothetical protein LBK99_24935 [Opitutaceae bacterium]|nr:hypothetical protein [Opitutaceae bacterium]
MAWNRVGQPLTPAHRSAPLDVARLDAGGGAVTADLGNAYPAVEKWIRHVEWTASTLRVRDELVLKSPDIALFRWHLGAPAKDVRWFRGQLPAESVTLSPGLLTGNGFRIRYDASQPLAERMETMPDATLGHRSEHHCLVVRSAKPVRNMILNTLVETD